MNRPDNTTALSAADYDALIEKTIPYYASFHEETFHLLEVLKNAPGRWLDTGCGTGNLVMKALPLFPSTHFSLADPSAAMLEQARAKLATADPARVAFLGAAGSQDLGPELMSSFDVITAILCHHYLDRQGRRAAVNACYNLLRPGGVFISFEITRPTSERAIEIGKEYWGMYEVRKGESEDGARAHLQRFDREYFPITVPEHLDLLREAGFQAAELFWYSYMQAGFFAFR